MLSGLKLEAYGVFRWIDAMTIDGLWRVTTREKRANVCGVLLLDGVETGATIFI